MRRLWTVLAFAGLVVAMPNAAVAAKKPHGPKVATTAQLQAALLALDDMPTGYAADTSPASSSGPCNGPTIAALLDQGSASPSVASQFSKNSTVGPLVGERLAAYPTVAAAKAAFKAIADTYAKCTAWDVVLDSGTAYHATATPESFAKVGNQSGAWRSVVSPQSSPDSVSAQGDLVVVRKGNVLLDVSQIALASDSDLTAQMVGKSMKKLGRLGS